jgi:hypothetical protein
LASVTVAGYAVYERGINVFEYYLNKIWASKHTI